MFCLSFLKNMWIVTHVLVIILCEKLKKENKLWCRNLNILKKTVDRDNWSRMKSLNYEYLLYWEREYSEAIVKRCSVNYKRGSDAGVFLWPLRKF